MGGINFSWLAVWVLSPDWLSRKKRYATIIRYLGEAAAPGGKGAGRAPSLHLYSDICLTTEENHGKPQSGYSKSARLNSAERDSFIRLGHFGI
jgi:hypothetical protein